VLFVYYEQGGGDIYTSLLEGGQWTKPVPLNKNINTPFWETSASMSADGKRLFFTSSRPGGLGELDIYVSERDAKGEWGKAVNLGPAINTPGNEDAPFIHSDGKTLYFSSNGHPSMGSNDIFISEFRDGKWQKPRNLGYPINSIEYDGFLRVSDDKRTGYYSTVREDGHGASDLYSITFLQTPEERDEALYASVAPLVVEPAPDTVALVVDPVDEEVKQKEFDDLVLQLQKELKIVTVLKGKVLDANSGDALGATITLTDNTKNTVIAQIRSHATTGDFELTIPHGGNYGVATERAGYLFNSINFNVPQFAEYQEIDASILMVKAEVGSRAVLKNLFFDTGKADLKPESVSELDNIYSLLIDNPQLKVQINGHTDDTGDAESNKALSLRRATSVVNFLIEKGIASERLAAVGYGEERPLVSNDDETDGREINRRTEIEIIEVK
jgi:outer membrane protein OmpA-like peptidoglycan-associated protein